MTFSSDGAYQCAGQHNQLEAAKAEGTAGGGKLWQIPMPMGMAMAEVVAKVGIESRGSVLGLLLPA